MDSKREERRKSGKEVPTFDAKEISDPRKRFEAEKLIHYIVAQAELGQDYQERVQKDVERLRELGLSAEKIIQLKKLFKTA
jgi:hypothetical protein